MRQLIGHESPETAYVVEDYPYGFRLRTKIHYWIETTNKGQRWVSQTLNPRTGKWNTPKKSVYSPILVMVLRDVWTKNTIGAHVETVGIGVWEKEEELDEFTKQFQLSHDQLKQIDVLRAYARTNKRIKWTIREAEGIPTPEEIKQEEEKKKEESKIIHGVFVQEYVNIIKEKGVL